jgi:hypothetical protein
MEADIDGASTESAPCRLSRHASVRAHSLLSCRLPHIDSQRWQRLSVHVLVDHRRLGSRAWFPYGHAGALDDWRSLLTPGEVLSFSHICIHAFESVTVRVRYGNEELGMFARSITNTTRACLHGLSRSRVDLGGRLAFARLCHKKREVTSIFRYLKAVWARVVYPEQFARLCAAQYK